MIRVAFCCHGNICRSTLSESVFTYKVNALGLSDKFIIDSFATKNLSSLTQNETEIYYNSLYIRGITKLQENDKTGQNDLDLCKNHNKL